MEPQADQQAPLCEQCGGTDGVRPSRRIDQLPIILAQEYVDARAGGRGRAPWFPQKARRADVIVSTPRYRYVWTTSMLCRTCLAHNRKAELTSIEDHRRMTLLVGAIATVLAVILSLTWIFFPSAYWVAGLQQGSPYPAYVHDAPPPASTPYKPPFPASTPASAN